MTLQTWLRCSRCGRETPHALDYRDRSLRAASCVACGLRTDFGALSDRPSLSRVPGRIVSKPERVARELRSEPKAVLTFPRRLVSKPARVRREVGELIRPAAGRFRRRAH